MKQREISAEKIVAFVALMLALRSFSEGKRKRRVRQAEAKIFDLFYRGGAWTFDEIADELGLPVETLVGRFQQEMALAGMMVRPICRNN